MAKGTGAEQRGQTSEAPGASKLPPGLYVAATPIGNLADVSDRLRRILGHVDLVACEDTRVTGRLLAHLGLRADLIAYHDHNAAAVRPRIITQLKEGRSVALVSDAGTPLISDPGYRLVRQAHEEGLRVVAIPGPSAVTAALAVAGLPTDRFFFVGFLPAKAVARRRAIAETRVVRATLVLFETGPRLAACLNDLAAGLGAREAAICRELTKMFEEVRRGTLPELAIHYGEAGPPKGEIVLVVGPPAAEEAGHDVTGLLAEALQTMSISRAAQQVATLTGLPRKQAYALALSLRKSPPDHDPG
ncbi:MAG: 16S rRNA (cytidine(1402)-2'-O)-methyltransferase [Alphaproteobacteria bacterium]|nr:16S rRNA (cytidine(1402)-2'-O)-methyltransferase [Alphaproteobacteria bacterium]